jgi:hypothetical protein
MSAKLEHHAEAMRYSRLNSRLEEEAEDGDVISMAKLGAQYDHGLEIDGCCVVARDPARAEKWYLAAAENGNFYAQTNLGLMYIQGQGASGEEDYKMGMYWLLQGAKNGDGMAEFCLGECHEHGDGVEKDIEQAFYWYSRAARHEYRKAIKKLRKKKFDKFYEREETSDPTEERRETKNAKPIRRRGSSEGDEVGFTQRRREVNEVTPIQRRSEAKQNGVLYVKQDGAKQPSYAPSRASSRSSAKKSKAEETASFVRSSRVGSSKKDSSKRTGTQITSSERKGKSAQEGKRAASRASSQHSWGGMAKLHLTQSESFV